MILSRFRWYRRARGGYWAQVTAPLGLFSNVRWVRCPEMRPTPERKWEFYPSAVREAQPVTAYIDEWHCVEPCWAVPFSRHLADTLGTNNPDDFAKLVQAARTARTQLGRWPLVAESNSTPLPAMDALDAALQPFK